MRRKSELATNSERQVNVEKSKVLKLKFLFSLLLIKNDFYTFRNIKDHCVIAFFILFSMLNLIFQFVWSVLICVNQFGDLSNKSREQQLMNEGVTT